MMEDMMKYCPVCDARLLNDGDKVQRHYYRGDMCEGIGLPANSKNLRQRAEAAERERDELKRSIDGICEFYGTTNIVAAVVEMRADRKQREELAAQLNDAQETIKAMRDNIAEIERARFERTAPIDWRDTYQGETPLGIALDSMGDEVEP